MPPPLGIDVDAVTRWLGAQIDAAPPLRFDQILGGSSNLTYRVRDTGGREWVLRRPPANSVIASAHDMAREYRVMAALETTAVPVPRMYAICEDHAVTGATFYVMELVHGLYMESAAGAEQLDEEARRRAGGSMVDALAALHQVDPDQVGLGSLGRRDGYVARQLKRWFGQWEQMRTKDRPLLRQLHDELVERLPLAHGRTSIVHGDFSFRNCRFGPDGAVRAVLDWEISTLGDPLADLGYLASAWSTAPGAVMSLAGFPTRDDVVARYAATTGADVSNLAYYIAFNHWKSACIVEGVYARYLAGALGDDRMSEADRYAQAVDGRLDQARRALAAL